jgi:hypothetical protein
MRWKGQAVFMEGMLKTYKILTAKYEKKNPLQRLRYR